MRILMRVVVGYGIFIVLVKVFLLEDANWLDWTVLIALIVWGAAQVIATQLQWRRDMNKMTGKRMDD